MDRHITRNVTLKTDGFPGSWVLRVVVTGIYIVLMEDGFELTDLKVA